MGFCNIQNPIFKMFALTFIERKCVWSGVCAYNKERKIRIGQSGQY